MSRLKGGKVFLDIGTINNDSNSKSFPLSDEVFKAIVDKGLTIKLIYKDYDVSDAIPIVIDLLPSILTSEELFIAYEPLTLVDINSDGWKVEFTLDVSDNKRFNYTINPVE